MRCRAHSAYLRHACRITWSTAARSTGDRRLASNACFHGAHAPRTILNERSTLLQYNSTRARVASASSGPRCAGLPLRTLRPRGFALRPARLSRPVFCPTDAVAVARPCPSAMKKVRAGQLVRSASRRGKAASRFQFDISIDKVVGVKTGSTYYVKWARGVKVAATEHHTALKEHVRGGLLFNHEKISLLVTLYREGESRSFDEKDAKLSLIQVTQKKQERTIAKMHFNLADFAGVPSASATRTFKMNDKGGASSALSGITGVSGRSSEADDFDDLNIDDVPEPVAPTSESRARRTNSGAAGLLDAKRRSIGISDGRSKRVPSSEPESRSKRT
eukprot:IDg9107t1